MSFDLLFVWVIFCFIVSLGIAIFVDKYGDK